jgi:Arc/MetJ-type ribon-helix-helix transcriptional regulator
MRNVQISMDEKLLNQIDRAGRPRGLKRSQVVREALHDWPRKQTVEQFERDWINSLRADADDDRRAEEWLPIQTWGEQ